MRKKKVEGIKTAQGWKSYILYIYMASLVEKVLYYYHKAEINYEPWHFRKIV
jgi:hypothetical protein